MKHFTESPAGPLALFAAMLQNLIEDLADGMRTGALDEWGEIARPGGISAIHKQAATDMHNGVARSLCDFVREHGPLEFRPTCLWILARAGQVARGREFNVTGKIYYGR